MSRAPRIGGFNLHLYPSQLGPQESRLYRLSRVLQDTGLFSETHLVGIAGQFGAGDTPLDEGRRLVRLGQRTAGDQTTGPRAISRLIWSGLVLARYARSPVSVVNAHSVWTLPAAAAVAAATGARLVYSTHELETETPTMTGRKKVLAQRIERSLIRRCDLVSVVNEPIADWYAGRYSIARPTVAHNVPTVADPVESIDLKARLGIDPHHRVVIHTGLLIEGRNIPAIIAAWQDAPSDLHLVFLGNGALQPMVADAVSTNPRIHWMPPVEHDRVVGHVAAADAALCLIDTTSLSYRLSTPNKMFEALVARTPLLCTDLPGPASLMGSELWKQWHITDVRTELGAALAGLTDEKCAQFRASLPMVRPWVDEVAPLVGRYRELFAAR